MATLTVQAPGWRRPSGQMSRVPPARSTRHQARAVVTLRSPGSARELSGRLVEDGVLHGENGLGTLRRAGHPEVRRQRAALQAGQNLVLPRVEGSELAARDRLVADALERQRIDPAPVLLHPVVQMRAGGQAGGAGEGDDVPLLHSDARSEALG